MPSLVLFHPPLPERCVHLSVHSALQCLNPAVVFRTLWVALLLAALRSSALRHLPPFALSAAFLRALAGRHSGDYYGGSVALGLASRRRSRVPFDVERIEHDVGAPFIPFIEIVPHRLASRRWPPAKPNGWPLVALR